MLLVAIALWFSLPWRGCLNLGWFFSVAWDYGLDVELRTKRSGQRCAILRQSSNPFQLIEHCASG